MGERIEDGKTWTWLRAPPREAFEENDLSRTNLAHSKSLKGDSNRNCPAQGRIAESPEISRSATAGVAKCEPLETDAVNRSWPAQGRRAQSRKISRCAMAGVAKSEPLEND